MLHLAYDATIHGDWVSHYAIHLAAHQPDRALSAIHVTDGRQTRAELAERMHLLEDRCRMAGVALESEVHPPGRDVLATLLAVLPGAGAFVVCGTRLSPRGRGYLAGTVPERLMRQGGHSVLAIRVVQPGLLGSPRRLLLPLAGLPAGLHPVLPWLRLLAPDLHELRLLTVQEVSRRRFRRLSFEQAQVLRHRSAAFLQGVEEQVQDEPALRGVHLDSHPVVSDDVPKEIVIQANRFKSHLILLGVSARGLAERFFYGRPAEQVLANAPCDVAVYQSRA